MTITAGRDTLDFFDMWFRETHFSIDHTVAAVNDTRPTHPTLGLLPMEWVQNLTTSGDPNVEADSVRIAFGGIVRVYPWFLLPGSSNLGLMREETIPMRRNRMPGVYVDVGAGAGLDNAENVAGFLAMLEMAGIAPTLVTREHTENAGNNRWRFWWRIDNPFETTPEIFRLMDESHPKLAHLAWSAIIQRYAIKFGFAPVLNFNPRFRYGHMLYRMPGIDATIVARGAALDWRIATYHGIEERMDEIAVLRLNYGETFWAEHMGLFTAENEPPWDWVLRPMGWHCVGHGDRLNIDHWRSPGGETIATTEGSELRLRRKHSWTCGLKEVSDAGIRLDKRVVACVLGWDGEREAFIDHWDRTGQLYE